MDTVYGADISSKSFDYATKCLAYILNRCNHSNGEFVFKAINKAFEKVLVNESKKCNNFVLNVSSLFSQETQQNIRVRSH